LLQNPFRKIAGLEVDGNLQVCEQLERLMGSLTVCVSTRSQKPPQRDRIEHRSNLQEQPASNTSLLGNRLFF